MRVASLVFALAVAAVLLCDAGVHVVAENAPLKRPLVHPRPGGEVDQYAVAPGSWAGKQDAGRQVVDEFGVSTSETTRESWGERLQTALVGFFIGVTLLTCAFPLLAYAEGKYVHRCKALGALEKEVLSKYDGQGMRLPSEETDALLAEEGHMHMGTGVFFGRGPVHGLGGETGLTDPLFELTIPGSMRASRNVEMFQHHEEETTRKGKDSFGGGSTSRTTYSLTTGWYSTPQDCPHLSVANPPFLFSSDTLEPEGGFRMLPLNDAQVKSVALSPSQAARVRMDQTEDLTEHKAGLAAALAAGGAVFGRFRAHDILDSGTCLHLRCSEGQHATQVGDMRVTWTFARDGDEYSVLTHGGLKDLVGVFKLPFLCCGCCSGPIGLFVSWLDAQGALASNVDFMQQGGHSPLEMGDSAKTEAAWWRTMTKLAGFLMLWLGLYLVVHPVAVLVDVIGFVGSIVAFGLAFASFVVALVLYLLIVAFAWGMYHPAKAVAYVAAATTLIYAAHIFTRGDNAAALAAQHKML
jgi:hypothetical protein